MHPTNKYDIIHNMANSKGCEHLHDHTFKAQIMVGSDFLFYCGYGKYHDMAKRQNITYCLTFVWYCHSFYSAAGKGTFC